MLAALKMLGPFWQSPIMHAESVLFVQHTPNAPPNARLAFTPARILCVQSATLERTFTPADYHWTRATRKITLPQNSPIPFQTHAQLYPPLGSQGIGGHRDGQSDLLFGEAHFFHDLQTLITYDHTLDAWAAPPTLREPFTLPHVAALFARHQPLRILILGDSISTGANASGCTNAPPHQPPYPNLLATAIEEHFRSQVTLTNLSAGGKNSAWACDQLPAAIAARPDLAILAFGMNDAARLTTDQYITNIRTLIDTLQREVPAVDIILIATMLGNPEWLGSSPELYPQYRDALWNLRAPRIAIADLTTLWQFLTARKSYLDLTGNGLNHPNDFGHRIYAQAIWSILTSLKT